MTEIILVRHGETEWNASEIFRGRADIDLNETGLRQAELLGKYLSGEKIDRIYSSPLKRAVKTAEAIAKHRKTGVNIVENLIDFDCGEWQGLTVEQVKDKDDVLYQDWLDTPEQMRIPGGETLEDVLNRAMPFVVGSVMKCREGTIALVSHRVVLKVLICALLKLDNSHFWDIKIDNGAITRFVYDGNHAVLTGHNDTSYLKEIQCRKPNDF
jgi:broad specificity phosphatase PhoE